MAYDCTETLPRLALNLAFLTHDHHIEIRQPLSSSGSIGVTFKILTHVESGQGSKEG